MTKTTLSNISKTMADEFSRAVEAAEIAQDRGIDEAMARLRAARNALVTGMDGVRDRRREAAAIIAESLRTEEQLEDKYESEVAECEAMLDALKSKRQIAAPAKAKRLTKVVDNG